MDFWKKQGAQSHETRMGRKGGGYICTVDLVVLETKIIDESA